MKRLEQLFFAFCLAAWFVGLLGALGVVDLAGRLDLDLYPLFTLSAALGWVSGNVWVQRARPRPADVARRFWMLYFFGPPGILYLLRAMAPSGELAAAPLVPLLSFGVFAALFLVPVLLRPRERRRLDLRREARPRRRDDEPRRPSPSTGDEGGGSGETRDERQQAAETRQAGSEG